MITKGEVEALIMSRRGGGAFSAWGTLDATVPNLCGARAGHLTNQCLQEGSSLLTGEFPCF